ncbi:signal transduction histidine kinase [Scopulibacillus darangshiensis]|uniref:histidine kinase n=1 Tax=Scopulibacillus darangshiensis TaxID=442528 RepID=A0A4R2NTG1_9BACL|nr:ATP-binding protein [Scopulibacillus darangshiensis]TCP24841.1 signal transduction histidine kinase [Scopulibacillus darangshiensis]
MKQPLRKYVKRTNTLMYRFTIWYVLSLLFVTIMIGLIIIVTVSYLLFNNTRHEIKVIQDKLLLASKEKNVDWQEAIDSLLYPNYGNYYVKVSNANGKGLYYSHGWKRTFESNHTEAVQKNWLKQILWNKDRGLFLASSTPWTQKNGEMGTIHVAAQLNNITDFLTVLIKILLFAAAFGIFMGSLLIYFLTKRNIRPLIEITNSVSLMRDSSDLKKRVPVPKEPTELTELSTVFNTLLDKLEDQFEREKSFVANASHELKTPITALRGHLNLLKRWGKHNPKVLKQSLQAMDIEGEHMQRLVHQLLKLAQSTNPIGITRQQVRVESVIADSIKQLKPILNNKKIIMNVNSSVEVIGDPNQLRQVTNILLENALKYTNEGDTIEIYLSESRDKDCAVFSVSDTGIGIPTGEKSRIFERFYRIDKARSRKTGGTGLGLAIAKEIVDNHNGYIEVDSTIGIGSKFSVFLPLPGGTTEKNSE